MDQAKSHIPVPHYIHATQSSHAKRSTQPSIPAQVPPAKHRTMKNMLYVHYYIYGLTSISIINLHVISQFN